jgi:hypothetical protein
MDKKRSSLAELRLAGIERQLLRAQVVTRETLDDIKETSRVLRQKTFEVRARRSIGRPFTVDWTVPRLPRAAPLPISGQRSFQ